MLLGTVANHIADDAVSAWSSGPSSPDVEGPGRHTWRGKIPCPENNSSGNQPHDSVRTGPLPGRSDHRGRRRSSTEPGDRDGPGRPSLLPDREQRIRRTSLSRSSTGPAGRGLEVLEPASCGVSRRNKRRLSWSSAGRPPLDLAGGRDFSESGLQPERRGTTCFRRPRPAASQATQHRFVETSGGPVAPGPR